MRLGYFTMPLHPAERPPAVTLQEDRELTVEYMVEKLVICGNPDQVAEKILALREEAGDFSEIVYAGMDSVDPALAKRSVELMAEQVMPQVNAAIGRSQRQAVA